LGFFQAEISNPKSEIELAETARFELARAFTRLFSGQLWLPFHHVSERLFGRQIVEMTKFTELNSLAQIVGIEPTIF